METLKKIEFRQIRQTKICLGEIGQIRQKSARNWEPDINIFCLLENFQICQNCQNLADKSAIWQRWHGITLFTEWSDRFYLRYNWLNQSAQMEESTFTTLLILLSLPIRVHPGPTELKRGQ
jgi:hypothetical protein